MFGGILSFLQKEVKIYRKSTLTQSSADTTALVATVQGILMQPNLIEREFVDGTQGRVFYVYLPIGTDVGEGDVLEIEGKKYGVAEKQIKRAIAIGDHIRLRTYLRNSI